MNAEFKCPRCSSTRCAKWDSRHPLIVHWLLNPGIAINELLLGQRLPKVMYICRDCRGPLHHRTYLVCEACGGHHASMLWSAGHAFGHWFGLVCPDCGKDMPCLQNAVSAAVVRLTASLWRNPVDWARPRWLEIEKRRAERARQRLNRKPKQAVPPPDGDAGLWDRDLDA